MRSHFLLVSLILLLVLFTIANTNRVDAGSTAAPPTETPTTLTPTTETPTTTNPTTDTPTTLTPTTESPTTDAPTTTTPTEVPTEAPTTTPTTNAPAPPTRTAPVTEAPTTETPTTEIPTRPTATPAPTMTSNTTDAPTSTPTTNTTIPPTSTSNTTDAPTSTPTTNTSTPTSTSASSNNTSTSYPTNITTTSSPTNTTTSINTSTSTPTATFTPTSTPTPTSPPTNITIPNNNSTSPNSTAEPPMSPLMSIRVYITFPPTVTPSPFPDSTLFINTLLTELTTSTSLPYALFTITAIMTDTSTTIGGSTIHVIMDISNGPNDATKADVIYTIIRKQWADASSALHTSPLFSQARVVSQRCDDGTISVQCKPDPIVYNDGPSIMLTALVVGITSLVIYFILFMGCYRPHRHHVPQLDPSLRTTAPTMVSVMPIKDDGLGTATNTELSWPNSDAARINKDNMEQYGGMKPSTALLTSTNRASMSSIAPMSPSGSGPRVSRIESVSEMPVAPASRVSRVSSVSEAPRRPIVMALPDDIDDEDVGPVLPTPSNTTAPRVVRRIEEDDEE